MRERMTVEELVDLLESCSWSLHGNKNIKLAAEATDAIARLATCEILDWRDYGDLASEDHENEHEEFLLGSPTMRARPCEYRGPAEGIYAHERHGEVRLSKCQLRDALWTPWPRGPQS